MSSNGPRWDDVAEKLRRAMGLCPPTPGEADEAIAGAGEVPMTGDEISRIVSEVTKGSTQGTGFHPDHRWADEVDTSSVADDMMVMNRNPGESDEEVEKRLEELRREALEDDNKSNGQA